MINISDIQPRILHLFYFWGAFIFNWSRMVVSSGIYNIIIMIEYVNILN
jgi:hypothetical protein